METIRICKDRNVLKEYLEQREQEVMTSFFDEEEILKYYVRCERQEAAKKAAKRTAKKATRKTAEKLARETAERMIRQGKLSLEEITEIVPSLSLKELKEIEAKLLQPAQ